MPGRDRTGPMGTGAMSGRGAGYCAGYGTSADTWGAGRSRRMGGMGYGRGAAMGDRCGAGFGRSRRRWFSPMPWLRRFGFGGGMADAYQAPNPELERQALRRDAEALQVELEMIQQRLAQMEDGTVSK